MRIRRLWYSCQSNNDNFPIPERDEDVRVSLGETDGLYGELEGEGSDQAHGVQVPQAQVAVLVSVKDVIVVGKET